MHSSLGATPSASQCPARPAELELSLGRDPLGAKPWREFEAEFRGAVAGSVRPRTLAKYEFVISRFGLFLRTVAHISLLSNIQPVHLSSYAAWRAGNTHPTRHMKVGREGIKADLRILKRVFGYAMECGYVKGNPVKGKNLSSAAGNTQPFTREEARKMLAACGERDGRGSPIDLKPVILFFLSTGLRISDVIHFPREAVNLESGQIILKTIKRGQVVSIPLSKEALASIRAAPAKESALLFSTESGKPILNLDASLRRRGSARESSTLTPTASAIHLPYDCSKQEPRFTMSQSCSASPRP